MCVMNNTRGTRALVHAIMHKITYLCSCKLYVQFFGIIGKRQGNTGRDQYVRQLLWFDKLKSKLVQILNNKFYFKTVLLILILSLITFIFSPLLFDFVSSAFNSFQIINLWNY